WYANVMSGVPDYAMMVRGDWDGGLSGLDNPWTSMVDEVASYRKILETRKNSQNTQFHRWSELYKPIRQANIFLKKAHPIPKTGTNADYLGEEEFKQLKANVIFM